MFCADNITGKERKTKKINIENCLIMV